MTIGWGPWTLDVHFPADCGGHSYRHSSVQTVDQHRKAERAFYASGKWQVAHAHEEGGRCSDDCQVYGDADDIPVVRRGYIELEG